jgi:hypothetical protein
MVLGGFQWISVVLCGFKWIYVVLCGFKWISVVLCGFKWISVVLSLCYGKIQRIYSLYAQCRFLFVLYQNLLALQFMVTL